MADIKKLSDAKRACCYCGLKENHPDFTCPRIAAVELDTSGTTVHFLSPDDWAKYLKETS